MSPYHFSKQVRHPGRKKTKRVIGLLIVSLGLLTIGYFFFPIIFYQMFFAGSASDIAVPVPKRTLAIEDSFANLLSQGVTQITTDFTDARNWYPQVDVARTDVSIESYKLSIPKLEIEDAEVSTIDYDLEKHLIQYAGTSTPGERGTSVIFGHSTLPQFFKADNYKTIFATLHTISEGDAIIAEVDGKKYKYTIFSKIITTPEDTDMFTQSFDNSYITIVTCTPPGTVWKRLVVKARMDTNSESASNFLTFKYGAN